jgi:hypothetical protein
MYAENFVSHVFFKKTCRDLVILANLHYIFDICMLKLSFHLDSLWYHASLTHFSID